MTQHIAHLTIWENSIPVPDGIPGEYNPSAVYVTIDHLDGHRRIYRPSAESHTRLQRFLGEHLDTLDMDFAVKRGE